MLRTFVTNWLVTDPKYYTDELHSERSRVKNYHSNDNFIYFLGGRYSITKAKPIVVLLLLLIIAPAILFWIFLSSYLSSNYPSLLALFTYFWFLSISFFIRASTHDLGILPRNIHLPQKPRNNQIIDPPEEYFNSISLPYINSKDYPGVIIKYCSTCHIWRPPRSSHCAICDVCVLSHDHHCVFLNSCVGYRNYTYFIWFLLSITITCGFLILTTSLNLFTQGNIKSTIKSNPVSLLLFIYSLLGLWYPLLLLLFHIFLTSQNLTTREYLNNVRADPNFEHVYSMGILQNLYVNWLGKPRGASFVRLTEIYKPGDVRFRKIDPLRSFG